MYEESNGDDELARLQAPVKLSSAESINAFPSNTLMYMRKKSTSNPDLCLDAAGGRISLFRIRAHVPNTERKQVLLTSKQFLLLTPQIGN